MYLFFVVDNDDVVVIVVFVVVKIVVAVATFLKVRTLNLNPVKNENYL